MRPDNKLLRMAMSCLAAVGFGSGLSTLSCGPSDETLSAGLGSFDAGTVTVYDLQDIASGLVGGIDFGNGNNVYIFGEKDADGRISNAWALGIVDQDGNFYEIYFDELGLPIQIRENGAIWDFAYDAADPSNITRATVTHDGQSETVELAPEFNELFQMVQNDPSMADFAARGFNRYTALGIVQFGVGMASFAALATVGSGVAVGIVVVGITATLFGSAYTIAASLSDRPPPPQAQRLNDIASVLSLASSGPTAFLAHEKFISGASLTAAECINNINILSTVAGIGDSPLGEPAQEALQQAGGGQTTANATINGCWQVTLYNSDPPGAPPSTNIWDFQNNRLVTVWLVDTVRSGQTSEFIRLNRENPSWGGRSLQNVQSSTQLNTDGTFVLSYSYEVRLQSGGQTRLAGGASITVTSGQLSVSSDGSNSIAGAWQIHSQIVMYAEDGTPRTGTVNGGGTFTGAPTACPDASRTEVFSLEELRAAFGP